MREANRPGVRQATKAGLACSQAGSVYTWLPPTRQSEDCLYLNVWTPPTPAATPRPVLVFFYGGSYIEGDDKFALYDASELVGNAARDNKGTIVVVANYRCVCMCVCARACVLMRAWPLTERRY